MQLTANATALLVIDMQNSFCVEAGGCGKAGFPVARLRGAIAPCAELIALARRAKVPVIYSRYVFAAGYADGGLMLEELWPHLKAAGALLAGTRDIDIIDELTPRGGDIVIDKNRPSAFFRSGLDQTLERLQVRNVVVCGVTTNCCVETTVRDAAQRDYRTFVVQEAVAEFDDERHAVALKSMAQLFARVITIPDVAAAWRGGPQH